MSKPKDVIKQIKKETRRQFSAEQKIRIVLEGLRGETPISEICRLIPPCGMLPAAEP